MYAKNVGLNFQQNSRLNYYERASPTRYTHTEILDKTIDILQHTAKFERKGNTPCARKDKKNGNMNSKWNWHQNDPWTFEPTSKVVLMAGCGFEPQYQDESLKGPPSLGKQQEAGNFSKAL